MESRYGLTIGLENDDNKGDDRLDDTELQGPLLAEPRGHQEISDTENLLILC